MSTVLRMNPEPHLCWASVLLRHSTPRFLTFQLGALCVSSRYTPGLSSERHVLLQILTQHDSITCLHVCIFQAVAHKHRFYFYSPVIYTNECSLNAYRAKDLELRI